MCAYCQVYDDDCITALASKTAHTRPVPGSGSIGKLHPNARGALLHRRFAGKVQDAPNNTRWALLDGVWLAAGRVESWQPPVQIDFQARAGPIQLWWAYGAGWLGLKKCSKLERVEGISCASRKSDERLTMPRLALFIVTSRNNITLVYCSR